MAVNNKVKITIDGKSFTLMGPETEEHMMQVAGYIDQKMTEIRKNSKAVAIDSSLAYILTSINVANDYFKEVKQHLEQEESMEELRLQVMSEKQNSRIAGTDRTVRTGQKKTGTETARVSGGRGSCK